MQYVSLFSGIGGLDRAIDALGGDCVVQVERDPYCLSVLRERWANVPKHDDVTTYHPVPGTVDMIVGGPPCQPISAAGRRKGADDVRWLWPEALRVLRESQAPLAFFENPMGLRTLGLDGILAELSGMGYGGAWEVVAAADVGALHLRKRLFIMAVKGRSGWDGPTRPPSNSRVTWVTPRAQDGKHAGATDYELSRDPGKDLLHVRVARAALMPTPSAADGAGGPGTSPKRTGGLNLRTYADRWPTPTSRDWKDSGDSIANGTVPVNGLLGRAVGPSSARGALNPDWVEWLMGLPVGWTDVTVDVPGALYGWESEPDIPRVGLTIPSRRQRLTALGNAVVPQQAEFAFRRLIDRLTTADERAA